MRTGGRVSWPRSAWSAARLGLQSHRFCTGSPDGNDMTKPHHKPKETPKVQAAELHDQNHGNTDIIRKLDRWDICIKWFLREMRTIILSCVSIAVACGVTYNHFHSLQLHHATQQRLDQYEVRLEKLEAFTNSLNNPAGSFGKNTLTGTNYAVIFKP
jgi:hypothetical protein